MPISILKEKDSPIKSAKTKTRDEIHRQLSAELLVLMDHISGTPKEKLHHAKKMLSALLKTHGYNLSKLNPQIQRLALRAASDIIDNPSKSFTNAPQTTSTAKDIKLPTQSTYQTKDQCISGIIGENPALSSTDAEAYCNTIFGNQQRQALSKKEAETANKIRTKQASIEDPPYWTYAIGLSENELPKSSSTNLKNASVQEQEYLKQISEPSGAYALERNSAARINRIRAKEESAIKSASESNKKPAWARVYESFWGTS
jgi:hypothetical protein